MAEKMLGPFESRASCNETTSIIEVLVGEIEHIRVLPPPNKRKIGFDL